MKLAFLSVPATDLDKSRHFYTTLLGLAALAHYDGKPHRYTDFDLGNARLKVFEWLEGWHAGPYTSFMLETPELDELLRRVADAGFATRPAEILAWGGRVASVVDPAGNIINLLDALQPGHQSQN